ncbi:MAG: hypothetical protein ACREJO_05965 [Phycisphaerales bacterium]
MRIRSIFMFLLGDRESILELAHSRWTLLVGGLLVLSAGLARNYDGEDLVREPWYLLGPFGASIATSAGLFTLLLIIARVRGGRRAKVWASWRLYPRFLALYWMTAPLAWLYAVPYERFTTPVHAIEANLWTLMVVAAWRVLVIARVVSILTKTQYWPVLLWTACYGAGAMFLAALVSPRPVLDLMGGLGLPPEDRMLASAMLNLTIASCFATPALLTLAVVFSRQMSPKWPPPFPSHQQVSARSPLALAAIGVLAWLPSLIVAQPEQRLRHDVEAAMDRGDVSSGLAVISAHARHEFPPGWRPPPLMGPRHSQAILPKICAEIDAHGAAPWVIDNYVRQTQEWLNRHLPMGPYNPGRLWTLGIEKRFEQWRDFPKTPFLKSDVGVRFLLRHDPTVTPLVRERIERMLETPGFIGPNGYSEEDYW